MNLFDEVTIGGVTLKNRLVVAPMGVVRDTDGGMSKQQADYLVERAKGGFGLIYPAAVTITAELAHSLIKLYLKGEQ